MDDPRQRQFCEKIARHMKSMLASLERGYYRSVAKIGSRRMPDGRLFEFTLSATWVNKPSRRMKPPGMGEDGEPVERLE